MPDQKPPENHNPDTRPVPPAVPPEMPDADGTRTQQPIDRTRAMPPVSEPPPTRRATTLPPPPPPPRPAYAGEKPKRGQPQPPRRKADSGFYLPLWSIGFMLVSVALVVACFVLAVLSLGGGEAPPTTPRFVIITAEPTLVQRETLPVLLVSPTLPAGFGPGFGGTIPAFSLSGPTLEPVVFTATPTPRVSIQVGSVIEVVSSSGARVRITPGTDNSVNTVIDIADRGDRFVVLDGPREANGLTWWQVSAAAGNITGWVAESDGTSDLVAVVTP